MKYNSTVCSSWKIVPGKEEMTIVLMELCPKLYCIDSSVSLSTLLLVTFHMLLYKTCYFLLLAFHYCFFFCKHTLFPQQNSDSLQEIQEYAIFSLVETLSSSTDNSISTEFGSENLRLFVNSREFSPMPQSLVYTRSYSWGEMYVYFCLQTSFWEDTRVLD